MDADGMAALDLRFMARELRQLVGGRVQKIYQYGKREFLLELHVPGAGAGKVFFDQSHILVTSRKPAAPAEPPSFCMFLRKHLMGKQLRGVTQYLFDRILEFQFPDAALIIELVPPGNVILCEADRTVIMPLEIQRWKDRDIRPKILYRPPPLQADPFKMGIFELQLLLAKSDRSIGAFTAATLGLGGLYGREACARAGLAESVPARSLQLEDISKLHTALESMGRGGDAMLYGDVASPLPLHSRPGGKACASLSEAADELLATRTRAAGEEKVREERERLERVLASQQQAQQKLDEKQTGQRETADLIYRNYSLVEGILSGIRKARDAGLSWEEIRQRTASDLSEEAQAIREIREGEGIVVAEIAGKAVELDVRLGVEENAARYYEGSKEARQKLAGLAVAREAKEKELESAAQRVEEPHETGQRKARKRWYEKFAWFVTSDGFVVVGGRDARQNETIQAKHCKAGDRAFHADIPGAALVVIQAEGRQLTETARKEAAEFAAARSKAWGKGFGAVDVYGVDPSQINTSPPSGQYLPKGSFIITGEREWYRTTEVKLAIGAVVDQERRVAAVMAGPVMAVRRHAACFTTIRPGLRGSLELARSIKNRLLMKSSPESRPLVEQLPLQEIQQCIPAGMGEIVEYG